MKRTFQTSKENITEVIYNKKKNAITFKKWWLKGNSKKVFVNWAIYQGSINKIDDFDNCTLRDLESLTNSLISVCSKYPNPNKHISKFNIY